MFYVYVLKSGTHRYVGSTNNLKRRFEEHNAGQNMSTKAYLPWEIIFYEAYISQEDALRREKYLKTSQGRRSLNLMLRNYLESLGE
ncbi:MAG TPA: GIY-YIG nuclease family protein [Candidatus Saccharibacteria bacterium]|nr:GIY-YIG nuclease family protein [Candidatus Saccharibacteria bacterium]